jgi:hypothetical protein
MDTNQSGEKRIKWQKIAAFLLIVALLLPLLVTVAGPLSSGGAYLAPDSQEFWSSLEINDADGFPTINEVPYDNVAVNWGSRMVSPTSVAVNWGSRMAVPTKPLS